MKIDDESVGRMCNSLNAISGLWPELPHVRHYDYWLCDTCGYRVKNGQPMYNYCPNCGSYNGGKN